MCCPPPRPLLQWRRVHRRLLWSSWAAPHHPLHRLLLLWRCLRGTEAEEEEATRVVEEPRRRPSLRRNCSLSGPPPPLASTGNAFCPVLYPFLCPRRPTPWWAHQPSLPPPLGCSRFQQRRPAGQAVSHSMQPCRVHPDPCRSRNSCRSFFLQRDCWTQRRWTSSGPIPMAAAASTWSARWRKLRSAWTPSPQP